MHRRPWVLASLTYISRVKWWYFPLWHDCLPIYVGFCMEGIDPGMKKSVICLSLCAAIVPSLIESCLLVLAGFLRYLSIYLLVKHRLELHLTFSCLCGMFALWHLKVIWYLVHHISTFIICVNQPYPIHHSICLWLLASIGLDQYLGTIQLYYHNLQANIM